MLAGGNYEEIMTYNQIMNHIEQSEEDGIVWRFKRIAGHEGPLTNNHPMWKGSTYNVCVEWENGEITNEPMTTIAADDPVTCAFYDHFLDCLHAEGFFPCKAEPDIWLRPKNGVYEYIAVYVDDLAIAMAEPQEFVDVLEQKHKFKLKGTGTIAFHLSL
jgi:hypothetical protein